MKTRIAFQIMMLAALPGAALAHPSAAGSGFETGWLHAFTAMDHLLTLVIAAIAAATALAVPLARSRFTRRRGSPGP